MDILVNNQFTLKYFYNVSEDKFVPGSIAFLDRKKIKKFDYFDLLQKSNCQILNFLDF